MYEQEAKELAYQQIRGQQYQATVISQGAQLGYANTCEPPKPTVAVEIINRLENLHAMLRDVLSSQKNLMERLHGPSPEAPCGQEKSSSPSGHLPMIDERFNWILRVVQEIQNNQQTLSNLA